MSKKLTVLAVLVMILFYAGSGPTYRAQTLSPNDSLQKFRPNEVIVEIEPGASISDVNQRNQTTTIRRIYGTNYYRLRIPLEVKEDDWIERLKSDPDVLDARLNPVVTSPFTSMSRSIMSFPDGFVNPNRKVNEYQSQLQIFEEVLKLGDAHLRSTGEGTVVAIIDTGVDISHPVLASRIWTDDTEGGEIPNDGIDNDHDGLIDDYRGWDFIGNDNNPTEVAADPRLTVAGHGTFIAGLIAQVAPDSRIMPIRAFTPDGDSDEFTVSEAIKYAFDHGANVINLSFGSPEDFHVMREAIDYVQRRSIMVAAAGNENSSQPPQYPANITDAVIGVAAVNMNDQRAYFSNYGRSVSLTAPGCLLISTYPGDKYASWSGTSFATPIVVSEAALMLAYGAEAMEARAMIEDTCVNIDELNPGFEGQLGRGRISPLDALQSFITNSFVNGNDDLQSDLILHPVDLGSFASGEARIRVSGSAQELRISASGLNPRQRYKIVVNGVVHPAGLLVSSSFGALDTLLSNQASGDSLLPSPLYPVTTISSVEVRNDKDHVILTGTLDNASNSNLPDVSVSKEALLVTTGALSAVTGKAQIEVNSVRESLSIRVEGLTSGDKYQVVVDGISLGAMTAGSRSAQPGFAKITYTSDGSSGNLLIQSLRPAVNISNVKILYLSGQVFAQGSFHP